MDGSLPLAALAMSGIALVASFVALYLVVQQIRQIHDSLATRIEEVNLSLSTRIDGQGRSLSAIHNDVQTQLAAFDGRLDIQKTTLENVSGHVDGQIANYQKLLDEKLAVFEATMARAEKKTDDQARALVSIKSRVDAAIPAGAGSSGHAGKPAQGETGPQVTTSPMPYQTIVSEAAD